MSAMMDFEGTELRHRCPAAETFALLADPHRAAHPAQPVPVRGAAQWVGTAAGGLARRDSFYGEDWPWPAAQGTAVDALVGQAQSAGLLDGRVQL
jgi:hypothetical protein